jgi:FkbM family methyltransferase
MNLAEIRLALRKRARRPGRIGALLAGAALKVTPHGTRDVNVQLWGRQLRLPAYHHLPYIVGNNPLCFMPLVHGAAALTNRTLTVVDIGANVGDSALLLESHFPGRCKFICVEPNPDWIPYLKLNTAGLSVEIIPRFLGEGQRLSVRPREPGSAAAQVSDTGDPSIPLDEICDGKEIDFIKLVTEGFEFPILRSGKRTLSRAKPALIFEWDPALWREQKEEPSDIFAWLAEFSYQDFCFFSDSGIFYCRIKGNQAETIRSLLAVAECRNGMDTPFWDVLAAPSEVCDRAIQNNVVACQRAAADIRLWNRLQPTYWQ